jgi:murein DD-endopeptidase MepM/ murein hydrolase activator NlpD
VPHRRHRSLRSRVLAPTILSVAALTIIGSVTAGTALSPGSLTSAGTIANRSATPPPAVSSAADAPPPTIPDAGQALSAGAPPVSSLTGYRWPLPHGRITLPFGPTPWGEWLVDGQPVHDGIDLATFCGDKVVAAHDGTVLAAGRHFDDDLGWVGDLGPYYARLDTKKLWPTLPIAVVIDDGNGYRSIYAHFEKIVVEPGQLVHAGELLGYEGRTGHASGCHLHYGLFSPFEPATFALDPAIVKRMKVPGAEIARIDPRLVFPPRPRATPTPAAGVPLDQAR